MHSSVFMVLAFLLIGFCGAAPSEVRQAGPSGTLLLPQGGAVWDNGFGFGLGRVLYQGIDEPLGKAHYTTHHIDIYLEAETDTSVTYYLAQGLAPNSTHFVDAQFLVPWGYDSPHLGNYRLVIIETQEKFVPGIPFPVTFQAAAPLIQIVASGPAT
ncbi:hypothetical protein CALCODRAFT_482440 [Calocera cornea HHB12733]|uniref:Uncharacterized protein n=1 Tax=Calocera cornea HHB12733 TaxID=1353952 RepID=A0A165GQB1_9BASI|nr:hypothetical protein CALCODRAFT_482440 [Calocera cornea HHB12733]